MKRKSARSCGNVEFEIRVDRTSLTHESLNQESSRKRVVLHASSLSLELIFVFATLHVVSRDTFSLHVHSFFPRDYLVTYLPASVVYSACPFFLFVAGHG